MWYLELTFAFGYTKYERNRCRRAGMLLYSIGEITLNKFQLLINSYTAEY